jgi:class 3 adenylate cyclase/tetratricopeptide (TPR) repeat protein
VICANCGTENEAGRKFCDACGTSLAAACPECGASNRAGARFCADCGVSLAGGEPAPGSATSPTTAAPVAERRVVSILFADLIGFTPFAEERDAEEVRDTLTRYFDLASDVIRRYGGTVEKFIGDAIMAVWGAPTAHEDDAERAVRAGLDLVDAVHSLGPNVQARAAVLTGEAAVTLGAVNQGMVAGDLVNTASRLQSVAPPGSVLVGESTQRAAGRAIAFEEAGEQVLKGKAAPVPAWRALRLLAEVGGRNRAEGLEAPFVGREDELRLLKDLFLATGREARIRLVSVIGPAGIGKSRLAWEFLKYVDGLVEDTWWHSGRSPAYGEGITFWALGEMVRGRCGLVETDDEATTRNKVRTAIQQWITDEREQAWVEGALLSLLGVESSGASEELFAAWRTFFERIAAHAPVVMVFEDLHFADSGTLYFIDHLLEWSRGVPIYVVTLARPELLEKRPDWGAGKRSFTSLYLEPLPEAAMREMLAGLIPGLPESAVAAIVARADGIPLYAVETVRMLLAEGRLTEEDGAYAPVGDLAELAVPQTLTALVAARLDGLAAADRSLVHDAAVLGQSFTTNGLSAVSGVAAADLEPRLAALVRQELFSRDTDPRSPERGQYAFVQALIREVAYNTLAKPDRRARHLSAARYFESLGSDELAGALAGHYLAAHANAAAGPEADALASQARIALRAAAERAAALGAHDQAVAFLDQALTVTTDPAEQGEILERAAASATTAGHYGRAEALCRQAIDLYRGLGDRVGAARATTALGSALLHNAQQSAGVELLESASADFADLAPDPVVVALDGMLINALGFAERYPEALVVAERVLEAAEHRGLTEVLADALLAKGSTLAAMGRIREGIGIIKAGEDLARDAGLTASHLRGIQSRTFFELEIDNLRALAGMREGLELARRTGERGIMLRFANNVGFTAYLSGEWDEAIATLEEPLAEGVDPIQRAVMLGNALVVRASRGESIADGLAELDSLTGGGDDPDSALLKVCMYDAQGSEAFAAGRFGDARRAWHRVVELDTTQGPPYYYQSARAALWDRDLDAARSDLRALDETGVHGGVIEIRRATIRAALAALEGRSREAAIAYRQAIRDFEDQHLAFDASLTALDMSAFVGMSEPEVGPIAAAAREFFARVGARPFVERLDAAVGAASTASQETDGMPVEVAASTEAAIESPSAAALPAE